MFASKYLSLLIVTVLIFDRNQLIIARVRSCHLSCKDGEVADFKICTCLKKSVEGDEITSEPSYHHRCSVFKLWNGNECISLCPMGYIGNGQTCIKNIKIKLSMHAPIPLFV